MRKLLFALAGASIAASALVGCGGSLDNPAFGSDAHVRGVNLLYGPDVPGGQVNFFANQNTATGGANLGYGAASPYAEYSNSEQSFRFLNQNGGVYASIQEAFRLGSYSTVYLVPGLTDARAFSIPDNSASIGSNRAAVRVVNGIAQATEDSIGSIDVFMRPDQQPVTVNDRLNDESGDNLPYKNRTGYREFDAPSNQDQTVYVTVKRNNTGEVLLDRRPVQVRGGRFYTTILTRTQVGQSNLVANTIQDNPIRR
jgi:hypothetical protein